MYGYKPTQGKWRLMIWDYNIVLGTGDTASDGPGVNLFQYQTLDNNWQVLQHTYLSPHVLAALKKLSKVQWSARNSRPSWTINTDLSKRAVLPQSARRKPIKDFLAQAAPGILSALAAEDPGLSPVSGNSVITVSNNLVTLSGTAQWMQRPSRSMGLNTPSLERRPQVGP